MPRQRTEITRPKGINKDLSPFELPPEVWSDGSNVNFRRARTNRTLGYSEPFAVGSLGIEPSFVMYYDDTSGNNHWLYCGNSPTGEIRSTDGSTVTNIASGLSATRSASWSGFNFNGVLIVNNRLDHPRSISAPYTSAALLPNWASASPWGVASRCEVMRPYKNYLFALDCYDETGKRYPNMVRWSNPAVLGDIPSGWDPSVSGDEAGLYSLDDSPGDIKDGLTLGDYFVVYKTDAVWLLQFVGGDFVFSFRKLFGRDGGILSKHCVAEFEGQHFVLGPEGAYVHNGSSKTEVMDKWVKDELFLNVNSSYLYETKVVTDYDNKEIWVYYITDDAVDYGDGPYADKALIWNWEFQEWTIRDLQDVSFIAQGEVNPNATVTGTDWDSDSATWDSDAERWDGYISFNEVTESMVLAGYNNQRLYADGYVLGNGLYQPEASVKRIGIDFGDDRLFKYVTRVVPHIIAENDVTIRLYASDTQTSVPTLIEELTFDPSVDHDVDCHLAGRFIGIEFASTELFTLTGYTLEWEAEGIF